MGYISVFDGKYKYTKLHRNQFQSMDSINHRNHRIHTALMRVIDFLVSARFVAYYQNMIACGGGDSFLGPHLCLNPVVPLPGQG